MTTTAMNEPAPEQARTSAQLLAEAFEDHLTGLPNRRAFDDRFAELTAASRARSLALLLLDVDGLRQVNDRLGHEHGDHALCLVADVLRNHVRSADLPARLGGDEFGVLLPAIGCEEARALAERLQERISELAGPAQLTISAGIAWFDGDRRRTLLNADAALYRAKRSGRNLICVTTPSTDHPDLVVTDMLMPTMDGYDLVQDLRREPSTADIPGMFSSATYAVEEVRRLADAFLQQQPDRGSRGHARGTQDPATPSVARLEDLLSPRELEVLAIVAEGASNAEIAGRLVIADTTVQSHVKHILRKLGARNRTEAAGHYPRH